MTPGSKLTSAEFTYGSVWKMSQGNNVNWLVMPTARGDHTEGTLPATRDDLDWFTGVVLAYADEDPNTEWQTQHFCVSWHNWERVDDRL